MRTADYDIREKDPFGDTVNLTLLAREQSTYMDGNGRIGRFLMNVMLAAGGYPWTVIPLEKRDDYMDALESGSVEQDIALFVIFLGRLVSESLECKQVPQVPTS